MTGMDSKEFSKSKWFERSAELILNLKNNLISDTLYETIKPSGIILVKNIMGNKMYVHTDDKSIVPYLLLDNAWEKYKTDLFIKEVSRGMIIVDVGANIGYYTLIAANLVGPEGAVYAFEPEPTNYDLLCKNIKVNGYTNITAINKAVSNKTGKAILYYEKERIVNPSFSKSNVLSVGDANKKRNVGALEVETVSMDEYFEKALIDLSNINVIKVDVEGAEGLMIDGSEMILMNDNLTLFLEFWPEGLKKLGSDPLKLVQKLKKYGFKASLINEQKQKIEPIDIEDFYMNMKPDQGFDLLLVKWYS